VCSSARRKIVRGCPCEVDAPPPRGRDVEASLERSKRSREADAHTRRLVKRRRGRLAAFWLAKRTPPTLLTIDAARG
jgi:hypothetical protein